MIEFNYRNVSADILGEDRGLNLETAFSEYENKISNIIASSKC